MTKPPETLTILGIETSCDETAVAVLTGGHHVRSNVVATQFDVHAKYGGVVPELASRAHIENLDACMAEALSQAGVSRSDIDAIAVSNRPGLVGCLLIGVTTAKTLALAWGKPLIGVNHIHAHACSAAIELQDAPSSAADARGQAPRLVLPGATGGLSASVCASLWPAIALVVSGGHTSLFLVRSPLSIELLGSTIDDAAGEAFDKVASILGLGFPGGPIVERTAAGGNPRACEFPRTMLGRESLDFSFSGLKTAVLYTVHGPGKTAGGLERLSAQQIADIAASFQAAVTDVLASKTMQAVRSTGVRRVVVGGGVAANKALRTALTEACRSNGIDLTLTPMRYCTDNGAMIAHMGYEYLRAGRTDPLSLEARATS
jgi:N6-L-threonylcarbamoyladenine synthase